MSAGVYTISHRVTFVEKTALQVGDYTNFPMEVTLDQLAEIMYRVKYAEFTSSSLAVAGNFDTGVSSGVNTPRVQYSTGSLSDNYRMSGYWTYDDTAEGLPAYAFALDYLGSLYTETTSSYSDYDIRDIASDERGMWLPEVAGEYPDWNIVTNISTGGRSCEGFRNAFSWFSQGTSGDINPPDINIPWVVVDNGFGDVYETFLVDLQFTGRVGVVGDMEDFFNPTNQFFIEMLFYGDIDAPCTITSGVLTGSLSSTAATFTLGLSSGDLSIPLGSNLTLTGDIKCAATEWWPYAKNDPATAVWNTGTGAAL